MILVDTSVWVDHFNREEPGLQRLLDANQVLCHPHVIGELAVGNLKPREALLEDLAALPSAIAAEDSEVLHYISKHKLYGTGISYVDAHLLVAAALTPDTLLWTRDKRLASIAESLGVSARIHTTRIN